MKASVCISAFNKPNHLRNTLNSIVCQRPPFDYEVIVVDDGSRDGEVTQVCKEFPSVRCLRVEREPVFRNPCVARNMAYRAAEGEIIVAQSDEVIHAQLDTIEKLVQVLEQSIALSDAPAHFVIANVFNKEKNGQITSEFTGPSKRPMPLFFLGALYREDLYAVGGNDEDFAVGTGYEDAWFADCLINGLRAKPIYTTEAVGLHQWHPNYNTKESDHAAKALYAEKKQRAEAGDIPWQSSSGPWKSSESVSSVFTEIYETNSWGGEESVSGVGSSLDSTIKLRVELEELLRRYDVRTMLDLGCGDCNWISQVPYDGKYVGADVVEPLIESNRRKYPDRRFELLDATRDQLPKADLVLARDCLVHLSPRDRQRAIRNIVASGSTYLLTTTFPNHKNRDIHTGSWAPVNLQAPPYNFTTPLELINEDCREGYPHFNDKSLGLWSVAGLRRIDQNVRSLVVCVDYSELLKVTLPNNRHLFSETLVITSTADEATQAVARENGCELLVTDVFYRYGAEFNKGAAVEQGFDRLGREGWICVWDADIVIGSLPDIDTLDPRCLYAPRRHVLADPASYEPDMTWGNLPCPTKPHEFDGYCQLFNACGCAKRPWYGVDWRHAGGCDSDFQFQFEEKFRRRMEPPVLHLGTEGEDRIGDNWLGKSNRHRMPQFRADRKRHGTAHEKIHPRITIPAKTDGYTWHDYAGDSVGQIIPRVMRFFWQGRLSFLRYLTLLSFRKYNPDWMIELHVCREEAGPRAWRSHEVDDRAYEGKDYMDRVEQLGVTLVDYHPPQAGLAPAQVADLFRWNLLGRHGGFYADMDLLWVRPIDEVYESVKAYDAVFCLESDFVAIGFLGSNGCRLFSDLLGCTDRAADGSYQRYGSELIYHLAGTYSMRNKPKGGPRTLTQLGRKYKGLSIANVPSETVYPFDWRFIPEIVDECHAMPEETVGIHWFAGSEIAQRWNDLLTEDNWFRYRTTLTEAIGRLV